VLPEAPVRPWICSLPWGLRALLGYDRRLCADILAAVIAELGRSLKWRAKKPAQGDQLELLGEEDDRAPKALRHRWAWLLAHIFAASLECCPKCNGPMRWAEAAKTTRAALRLMAKLGLAPHPPPNTPATPLGQLSLPFGN
jgi:hypothetical protein